MWPVNLILNLPSISGVISPKLIENKENVPLELQHEMNFE